MRREHIDHDLKLSFDAEKPGAMLELVKDIVAFANSGGGTIRIGMNETDTPGIGKEQLSHLDSARVTDQVNRVVFPAKASIGHSVTKLDNGKYILTLQVDASGKYPFVFSKDGQYRRSGKTQYAFRQGDVYVRRGSQSVPISHQDMAMMIDKAEELGRKSILEYLHVLTEKMVRLPEGSTPIVLATTPSGELQGTPEAMLDVTIHRRKAGDTSAMLDGRELLELFLERDSFEMTPDRREILIRSALRRNATLYFWLLDISDRNDIERILLSTLDDQDRDKSDANQTILELGALYAKDEVLREILNKMQNSKYSHFRRAAEDWVSRDQARTKFYEFANSVMINGIAGREQSDKVLLQVAEDSARALLQRPRARTEGRLLRNIGRLLLARSLRLEGK